jgi:hypothetical protein
MNTYQWVYGASICVSCIGIVLWLVAMGCRVIVWRNSRREIKIALKKHQEFEDLDFALRQAEARFPTEQADLLCPKVRYVCSVSVRQPLVDR